MKWSAATVLLLLCNGVAAQAQEPVPLAHGNVPGEPHHHLKIENEYVRVYYVEVPPHENTQLHQHDHDYIYVSLGPADVINAILNKPEIHLQLKDGETHFTRGGFAHVARNLGDTPFRNITIELLKPQHDPRNMCRQVIPGPIQDCSGPPITRFKDSPKTVLPLFETFETLAQEVEMPTGSGAVESSAGPALVVSLGELDPKPQVAGKPGIDFGTGQVAWLATGQKWSIMAPHAGHLRILLLMFNDPAALAGP